MTWLYLSRGTAATLIMFPRLLLFSTEEWLQDNVVTGDEGRLGSTDMCLCLQGETKC